MVNFNHNNINYAQILGIISSSCADCVIKCNKTAITFSFNLVRIIHSNSLSKDVAQLLRKKKIIEFPIFTDVGQDATPKGQRI